MQLSSHPSEINVASPCFAGPLSVFVSSLFTPRLAPWQLDKAWTTKTRSISPWVCRKEGNSNGKKTLQRSANERYLLQQIPRSNEGTSGLGGALLPRDVGNANKAKKNRAEGLYFACCTALDKVALVVKKSRAPDTVLLLQGTKFHTPDNALQVHNIYLLLLPRPWHTLHAYCLLGEIKLTKGVLTNVFSYTGKHSKCDEHFCGSLIIPTDFY